VLGARALEALDEGGEAVLADFLLEDFEAAVGWVSLSVTGNLVCSWTSKGCF
jgi:hypothetical protein